MRRGGLTRRMAALALAASAALAGCAAPQGAATPTAPADPDAPPHGAEELARFYQQDVRWQPCDEQGNGAAQCGSFTVPIDYEEPQGPTMTLAALRVPARAGNAAKGAMLVNPGGPGGSAVDYAAMADLIVTDQIRRDFDIVGFDPRGVGRSEPIACVDAAGVDRLIGADPTPDDAAEREQFVEIAKQFGQACQEKYPQVLPHISTVEAARDMDILRAVLGQPRLTYLGKSYGTFLGAEYAGLFPDRVGRLVLDGALPPDLTSEELNLGQGEGFETATRAWAQACVSSGGCPLGGSVEAVMTGVSTFLKDVDATPLPVTGDPRVKELTEGWATVGLARAMYQKELWPSLTEAMRTATAGDGNALFDLAKEYAARDETGQYTGNLMQAISAVNCLDRGASPATDAQLNERVTRFEQKAPTWGRYLAWSSVTCEHWPVPATREPAKITADGSGPILVVGTTRDPATPYAWSQRLADQLADGHLLTRDGDGHTGYVMGNACVDKAVDAYLMNGTVPAEGTHC